MTVREEIRALPAFTALDGNTVLAGHRAGASVQIDSTYFRGRSRALQTFDGIADAEREQRLTALMESWRRYEDIDVGIDSLTERNLSEASSRLCRQFRDVPEVDRLARQFPGRCVVVPEWLRTGNRLHYGARVYFFRDGDPPTPDDIVRNNVDAIVTDAFDAFERYQGRLHGYPDCCIDFYQRRSTDVPSPEWRSVAPLVERIRDAGLGRGVSASIDDVLSPFPDGPEGYAFFARDFFPEPGCDAARTLGRTIYDDLSSTLPGRLVEDYFRLAFGLNYLVAHAVHTGDDRRPPPGELGREHLLFYLPLHELLTVSRYE